jgi:hypothetical protein
MSHLDLILHHHLQSNPLGSIHTDLSISATYKMHPGSGSLLGCLVPSAFPLQFPQLYQICPFNLIFIFGKQKKSAVVIDNLWKKVWILLKLLLKFPADFQEMLLLFILQQSWHNPPQSFSRSVPLTTFVDIYYNFVPRCYRGLGWSVYDLAESDSNFYHILWCDASWRLSQTIIMSSCSAIF